jgi:hypothetical protein
MKTEPTLAVDEFYAERMIGVTTKTLAEIERDSELHQIIINSLEVKRIVGTLNPFSPAEILATVANLLDNQDYAESGGREPWDEDVMEAVRTLKSLALKMARLEGIV